MSRFVSNIVSRRYQKIRAIRAICEKKLSEKLKKTQKNSEKLSEDLSEKNSEKTQCEKQQIVP